MAENFTFGKLHWADILVIALYYVGSLSIGLYTMCKTKNNINSFFLAGRSLSWWPIGMSLFASNIGSINFVGIAGSGAASGLAVVQFEWSAVFLLVLLGWVFVPVYITSGIYTIPEYLHKRFGGQRLRVYLSFIALLTYIFAILSVDLYSGALFIQQTVGWNIYIGVGVILGTTILFTTLGGLMTVVLTDAFAVVVMVIGGFVIFVIGIYQIGGFYELKRQYMTAVANSTYSSNTTCGYPREDAFHIFRDSIHADYPGLGTILRTTFGALWFWCCNQLIVQRSLAAKNIVHAKAGSILACYLKLTPMLIMVIPGMISRALYPEEVACSDPDKCYQICGNRAGCSNIAYPKIVTELLPRGLRGLVIAAMLAAVISSATSVFNSSSSIVTMDIWHRIRPQAKQKEQMIVAKVCLLILMIISVAWIPTMQNAEGGQIYRYAVASVGLFGGPTCGLFLVAVLTEIVNETGAFWALVIGQVWGIARFIMDVVFPAPPCGEIDKRPSFLIYWHVFYHVISQILITVIFAFTISLLTKHKVPKRNLAGMTFWSRYSTSNIANDYSKDKEYIDKSADHCLESTYYASNTGRTDCITPAQEENRESGKITENEALKHSFKSQADVVSTVQGKNSILSKYSSETRDPYTLKKFAQSVFYIFCKGNEDKLYGSNNSELNKKLNLLKETNFWTVFLNINAAVVVVLTIFLYIYFR